MLTDSDRGEPKQRSGIKSQMEVGSAVAPVTFNYEDSLST
jgi:hypothetical protein